MKCLERMQWVKTGGELRVCLQPGRRLESEDISER